MIQLASVILLFGLVDAELTVPTLRSVGGQSLRHADLLNTTLMMLAFRTPQGQLIPPVHHRVSPFGALQLKRVTQPETVREAASKRITGAIVEAMPRRQKNILWAARGGAWSGRYPARKAASETVVGALMVAVWQRMIQHQIVVQLYYLARRTIQQLRPLASRIMQPEAHEIFFFVAAFFVALSTGILPQPTTFAAPTPLTAMLKCMIMGSFMKRYDTLKVSK